MTFIAKKGNECALKVPWPLLCSAPDKVSTHFLKEVPGTVCACWTSLTNEFYLPVVLDVVKGAGYSWRFSMQHSKLASVWLPSKGDDAFCKNRGSYQKADASLTS